MWAILSLQGSTGWQASCADCPAGRSEPVVAQELVSRALPEPDGDIRTHKGVSHTTPTLTVGTARLTLPVSVLKNPELGGFPGGSAVKNPPAMQETQEMGLRSLGREDPLEMKWQPTPAFLPGKPHGQGRLGATAHGVAETDRTAVTRKQQHCEPSEPCHVRFSVTPWLEPTTEFPRRAHRMIWGGEQPPSLDKTIDVPLL